VKLSNRARLWLPPKSAFAGYRFPPEVIAVAVRWYLRFKLSYRDVEELLVEREIEFDHVTVYRWVQRFTPLLADAARFAATRQVTGGSWMRRMSLGQRCVALGIPRDRPVGLENSVIPHDLSTCPRHARQWVLKLNAFNARDTFPERVRVDHA
jgi:hypothetical protein